MKYYFLGIAGTAMASVAVLLKQKGHEVWGSDQGIYPPMSDFLEANQIPVWQGFSEYHLKKSFDLAVIGNALSRGNPEVEEILDRQLPFVSLPELIRREFIDGRESIVITGTHGKTTTTSLMSWVMECAGLNPGFMIGGIANNFQSSIQLGGGKYFVIEGDEYDCAFFDKRPKFVHYFPKYLILNNIEFDHADIYPDLASIKDVFRKLMRIVPRGGLVVANGDDPAVREVIAPVYSRLQVFSRESGDWSYRILEKSPAGIAFEILEKGVSAGRFDFPFPGEFQVQNCLAVAAVARDLGIGWETIADAFRSFRGVARRLDRWGTLHGAAVYDDFAHHPTAIRVTLTAMKEKFPDKRLVALFEPRTNTTVRNFFQEELARAFQPADVVIISPVHRQERIPEKERLSLPLLKTTLENEGKQVFCLNANSDIPDLLARTLKEGDVLVLLTNGSLGGEYQKLRAAVTR